MCSGKPRPFSGNMLKLIAAVTMLIDHTGYYLFPQHIIFRIIGRLAFPIFACLIAEGCHYTKNRLRYFLNLFLLGALWQAGRFALLRDTYMNILLTFSCSILLTYLLQEWKAKRNTGFLFLLTAAVAATYVLTRYVTLDYGFWGIMVPVLTTLAYPARGKPMDPSHRALSLALFTVGLLLVVLRYGTLQLYSLLALPLMYLYSGKRGKGKYKYAFYIFYPLHLIVLEIIAWLVR